MFHTVSNTQSNTKSLNNQAFSLNDWLDFVPMPNTQYGIGTILAFNSARIRVLNALLLLSERHEEIHISQAKIAKMTKLHIDTVWAELKELDRLGFISKFYRGVKRTCLYKISPWFILQEVQEQLSKKLPIFYYAIKMSIKALVAKTGQCINVFNFIYKNKQVPNVNISTYEEEEYQRKVLKKKGNGEYVMLNKIKEELGLGDYEVSQLSQYSDQIVQQSYNVLKKTPKVLNKYRFLLGVCKNIQAKSSNNPVQTQPSVVGVSKIEVNKYNPVHPPTVSPRLTIEGNLERFGQWYEEHAESYAAHYRTDKLKYSKRFTEQLTKDFADPEKVERWRKNAEIFEKQLVNLNPTQRQIVENSGNPLASLMVKLAQNSTTTNESYLCNTMNHKDKKISTSDEFEANLNPDQFEEVYD